jgi:hypothetical protein
MEQDIKNIIQDAILAPSGENCQPWSFVISGATVNLFNLPVRDQSLYNFEQCGSYVSHGALLENLKISAQQFGYKADIKLFPEPENKNHIATINLEKMSDTSEPALYKAISKRATNRKPYKKEILPGQELNELKESMLEKTVRILLTQENSDKKVLAGAGSINESVMMSNQFLHDFFFLHVTWTKEEDEEKKMGFFINTLELPLPAQKMFKLMENWKIANFLNKFGLYKIVGKQNAATYDSSSGFGVLLVKNTSPESFVRAGMALEQVWLTATNMGINFQPVSGLLFLAHAIRLGEIKRFTNPQKELIEEGYRKIKQIFSVGSDEDVVFMFRFGRGGGEPTAKSLRFNVEDFIKPPTSL